MRYRVVIVAAGLMLSALAVVGQERPAPATALRGRLMATLTSRVSGRTSPTHPSSGRGNSRTSRSTRNRKRLTSSTVQSPGRRIRLSTT